MYVLLFHPVAVTAAMSLPLEVPFAPSLHHWVLLSCSEFSHFIGSFLQHMHRLAVLQNTLGRIRLGLGMQ